MSELLDEICVNVRKESILQEVNNEDLPREANKIKKPISISVYDGSTISGRRVKEPFLT